ncbi:hypothetical protein [Athalassotoga saccharophila]|uniref:hypothetical protein n=1 Tax=Athalassotoga saccharophila TaxID=1441386 RepID=UPI00137B47E2|nr:hypothetical protein [Athalassotoga saccharophila]
MILNSAEEMAQAIDEITCEMTENVKNGKIEKVFELMKVREKQIEMLKNSDGRISQATTSKLLDDLKKFDEEYKKQMKEIDEKISNISKAIEMLQSYSQGKSSNIFDERR